MTFSTPAWLLLLPIVAIVLAMRWRAGSRPASFVVAEATPAVAAAEVRSWRLRFRAMPDVLRALALALLIIAIARPRQGLAIALIPEEGIDAVVALDVSSSMNDRVVTPVGQPVDTRSRLEAARDVVDDFVDGLEGDRVGLVVFQARAITLSPLTLDQPAIARAVRNIRSGVLVDGTAIGLGLAESLNVLRESEARSRVVVLLTDGQNNQGEITPIAAADLAEALGVRVYTIAFLGSRGGEVNVDVATLQQMAEQTGGRYFDASTADELAEAYATIGDLERSIVGERRFTSFREFGPALAAGAVALLLADALLRATWLRRYP
ncbi:MAG: VWA domain-containing protein [Dehalococcoidia bacterium]